MFEVCFVTCARLPDLDPDDRLALEPLRERGCRVMPATWDDPNVDWERFDLSIIRSTWDYTARRDDFVRWARSVPRLLNPAHVVEWNTDKHYLSDLAAAGVNVVPTTWISAADDAQLVLPERGEYVVKPSIGAGSLDAQRFSLDAPGARGQALAHVAARTGRGQQVMLQPFLGRIADHGETGVILIDGAFSHAIRKGQMLGPSTENTVAGLYREEQISARTPTGDELALAQAALAAAMRLLELDVPPLYARVDMVPDDGGRPTLMELELTEPSLFMTTTPGSPERFASAILDRIKKRDRARAPAQRARSQQERMVS